MVWNSAGSTLYKAVERHNTNGDESLFCKPQQEPPMHSEAYKKAYTHSPSPLPQLLQDRDTVLLLAVLMMLLHEKADTKLVLALAFVIFC